MEINLIDLFENYNQETQELHQLIGYNHFTIVINDDGFYLMM